MLKAAGTKGSATTGDRCTLLLTSYVSGITIGRWNRHACSDFPAGALPIWCDSEKESRSCEDAMRSRIRATLMWLRSKRWLLPLGTLLTLIAACAAGAIPILLAPSPGWRWVAVFASPTLGFITVVVAMECVHRARRFLTSHGYLPAPPEPLVAVLEEERALMQAMRDPGDSEVPSLVVHRSALGVRL